MRTFPFWLLIVDAAAVSAPSSAQNLAQLRAYVGDQLSWELTLTQGSNPPCSIELHSAPPSGPRTIHPLDQDQCSSLRALLPKAAADLHKNLAAKPEYVSDEPLFRLRIEKDEAPVEFKAPSSCEILETGDLKCSKTNRSPSEILVTHLRDFWVRFQANR